VIRHPQPKGYDAALAAGLNSAFQDGAKAAITFDADGQHPLSEILKVAEPVIKGEADFSVGVRNHCNRVMEYLCGLVANPIYATPDPFCGLKCYSRRFYDEFGPFPSQLNTGTLPLFWARKRKLKTVHIPIQVAKRIDAPRFGGRLKSNFKLGHSFAKTLRADILSGL
jgi:hypothetical protein